MLNLEKKKQKQSIVLSRQYRLGNNTSDTIVHLHRKDLCAHFGQPPSQFDLIPTERITTLCEPLIT